MGAAGRLPQEESELFKRPFARCAARTGAVLAVAAAAASGMPAAASAASTFTCEASALRGSVLTAPSIEPITANKGQAKCTDAKAGGADALQQLPVQLPLPLSLSALAAQTSVSGSDEVPGTQGAASAAGLVDGRIKTLPELPLNIPIPEIPAQLQTITIPVSQLPTLPGVPLPSQDITISIADALKALLPNGKLPNADVLRIQALYAYATAGCQNGKLAINGSSRVVGLTVLGQELPTDQAVDKTLSLVDTQSIDPSNIDVSKLQLPAGIDPKLLPQVQALIQPALDALPTISIPATLVHVKTIPNQTIRSADGSQVTQRALQVQISLLGQSLADLTVGEASVGARNVQCVSQTAVSQQDLRCQTRRLVLVDVLRRGDRVRLFGVADKRYIGKRVKIRSKASGKIVSRPTVRPDGTFSGTAPMPARHVRYTNRARYQASIGSERSLDLKLARRMVWSSLRSSGGKVILKGRVTRPFDRPMPLITVKRRVSCKEYQTVKRFRPRSDGRFTVSVAAPPKTQAATYRLQTFVRKYSDIPSSRFHTFTLPRTVEIR